uniref:Voltage-dependent calcium channel gamma-7 subunit n=1 Tax=Oryzias sinensis TaxID=183150 RepID=A0A8C7X1Z6_9TELE
MCLSHMLFQEFGFFFCNLPSLSFYILCHCCNVSFQFSPGDSHSALQMSSCSSRALTILSTVFGACGLLLVGVAVSTDYWLIVVEGIILQQNQSMEVKMALHSGLWRVCFVAGSENGRCVASEYFTEPEIEITTENTANILKMVRTATPFPMVSLLFVFTAFVISNIGHIRPQRTILAFVSGIFFILSGLSLVVGLVLYISSINDEVMNRPREPEQFFNYHYGWSFAFAASSFLLKEGAGVLSVYLFMKRYAEEEMYRPHPAIYRPRLSESSDYSGQYLHPESSWPPPKRGRSTSEASSDISIQLNQTLPKQPKSTHQGGARVSPPSASSSPGSYQMHPQSAGYPSTQTLPRSLSSHPQGQALPMTMPPSPIPPPHYHTHVRMSASPC